MVDRSIELHINVISELFYKKCFSYCRLCVAKSFKKNYRALLANDLYSYNVITVNGQLYPVLTIKSVEEEDILLRKIGVASYSFSNVEMDLRCSKIKESLSKGQLLIQTIDNYYYPPYSFLYGKQHSLHGFMIYGFDSSSQAFLVVEPWGFHVNRSIFNKVEIEVLDSVIEKSVSSFPHLFPQTYGYESTDIQTKLVPEDVFFANFNSNNNYMYERLILLKQSLENCFFRALEENECSENVLLCFRRLIEKKRSQWYQLKEIFENNEINNINLKIIEQFIFLRELYNRSKLKIKNKKVLMDSTKMAISIISELEFKLHNIIKGKF